MNQRTRAVAAGLGIAGIFLLVQLGALALVDPFKEAGFQAVENPQDPTNSVVYIGAILVATALMLAALRLDVAWVIRGVIVFSAAYLSMYVFSVVVPPVVSVEVGGVALNVLAVGAAAVLGVLLYAYPEWYVIDAAGIVMGAGGAGLFGISFGILPALLLLAVLAVYDAISVYRTEHMLTLASGVMELRVPIVLVVPLSFGYSFIQAEMPTPRTEEPADAAEPAANGGEAADDGDETDGDGDPLDRDALFIGLGDAVIPAVLVASAGFFAPETVPTVGVPGIALTLPALTAMLGTLVGLAVLLRMVLRGRAHAGLPLLNGGAIAGYLVGALASGIPLLEAVGLAPYL